MPEELINHEQLGKGALPSPSDARDFKLADITLGVPYVDFSIPFRLPEPPSENQGVSSSCVSQAWSYYHWQLKPLDFCRRDLYAWIYQPQGGAYIRDGGSRLTNYGQATRDEAPDPSPETELAMRDRTGLTPVLELPNKEQFYFNIASNIDAIAAAIPQYKGVVFGVTGSNEGWQNLTDPRPPLPGETQWGHALYLFGYCIRNGKKCVIAKSSWGNNGNTTVHYISEDYFKSGFTFDAWTLIPKEQIMTQFKTQNYKGELRIVLQADNEETWAALCKVYGKDPNQFDETI